MDYGAGGAKNTHGPLWLLYSFGEWATKTEVEGSSTNSTGGAHRSAHDWVSHIQQNGQSVRPVVKIKAVVPS